MRIRATVVVIVVGLVLTPRLSIAQAQSAPGWMLPRTAWGTPDLQRPDEFAARAFLSDEEVAAYEHRAATRADRRPPDDPHSAPNILTAARSTEL